MDRFRGRLAALAMTTLVMHVAVVGLSALRVCWVGEHTHAGLAAEVCPMHHHAPVDSAHHAHHAHDTAAAPVNDDKGQRLACDCGVDPTSPYVGPAGILVRAVTLSYSTQLALVSGRLVDSPDDLRVPPLAPPPRSTFSARS